MQEEIFKVHGTGHLQYKQKRLYASFVYIYMFFILPSDNARYIFRSPPLLHIIRPLSHISFLYSANCLKIPLSNNCLPLSKLPCKLLLLSFYLSSLKIISLNTNSLPLKNNITFRPYQWYYIPIG